MTASSIATPVLLNSFIFFLISFISALISLICASQFSIKNLNYSEAVLDYARETQSSNDSEKIFLLDLAADGEIQNLLTPEKLANYLLQVGLSEKTKNIYFLVSDTVNNHRLLGYAGSLSTKLAQKNCFVSVHCISDLNQAAMFISPPTPDHAYWRVFGIKRFSDCTNMESLDDYMANPHKQLLWEGNDITAWLNDPERTIHPPEQRSEFSSNIKSSF